MLEKNNIVASVIIPVYNEEKYIGKCLDSLKNQTYSDFEIIVVNDGSTDKTYISVSKYKIQIWNIVHSGPGVARNFGAEKAKGKILVFLDADMYVDKNYINNLIKPILSGKCEGTCSKAEYIGNLDNIWARCWNIAHDIPFNQRIIFDKKSGGTVFRAIMRNKFLSLKGFDTSFGYYDDKSLNIAGLKAIPVDNAVCYHNNPSTLEEVFFAARWIGRSIKFRFTFKNIIRYSIFNSLRISIIKIKKHAPISFILFKIVFDLGMLIGILFKNTENNYAK